MWYRQNEAMPDVNESANITNPYKTKMSMSSPPLSEVDSWRDLLKLDLDLWILGQKIVCWWLCVVWYGKVEHTFRNDCMGGLVYGQFWFFTIEGVRSVADESWQRGLSSI